MHITVRPAFYMNKNETGNRSEIVLTREEKESMKKRMLSLLMAAAMVAATLTGCGFTGGDKGKGADQSTKADGGSEASVQEVTMSMASDPQIYDPRSMMGVDMRQVAGEMYLSLLRKDQNGELQPGNAENWEISEDNTVYTFNLNKDVKWSDGKPVTAKDYVYAWTSALAPEYASDTADAFYDIKNAKKYNMGEASVEDIGVKAVDDYTLEVTMENPNLLFLENAASVKLAPVRQDVVEKYDDPQEWSFTPETLIVNGPFIMTENEPKQYIILEKNPEYYKADEIKLDRIKIVFVEEATTALASFKTDAVDICTSIPEAEIQNMLKEGTAIVSPMIATYFYSFNMSDMVEDEAVREAFSKVEVRKALSLAIDREAITSEVVKGGQTPAKGFVPAGIVMPDGSDWTDESDYIDPKADLEEAKKLLADAGYPNGEGFPTFQIFYNTSETHQAIAQAVQDMWKQGLGINVELVNKETKVFADERQMGHFQMTRSGNENNSTIVPEMLSLFTTDNIGIGNDPRYSNPEYDALIEKAVASSDLETRMEFYRQAEDLLMKDMPVIPIYSYTNVAAVKQNIKGFYQGTDGAVVFDYMYKE